jgi:hypothetical protein
MRLFWLHVRLSVRRALGIHDVRASRLRAEIDRLRG